MGKVVKLLLAVAFVGAVVQGLLSLGAYMDDRAFGAAVLDSLGDGMTAAQMKLAIQRNAETQSIPLEDPDADIEVTIECEEGGGPDAVASRLGSGVTITSSCTANAWVGYTRKVGLLTTQVEIERSRSFVAGAAIRATGAPSSRGMLERVPSSLPGR